MYWKHRPGTRDLHVTKPRGKRSSNRAILTSEMSAVFELLSQGLGRGSCGCVPLSCLTCKGENGKGEERWLINGKESERASGVLVTGMEVSNQAPHALAASFSLLLLLLLVDRRPFTAVASILFVACILRACSGPVRFVGNIHL